MKDEKKEEKKPEKKEEKKPEKKEEKKVDDKKTSDSSLWNRLGGETAVAKLVSDWFVLASENPKVNVTRDGKFQLDEKAVADLKKKAVEYISTKTGGPLKYSGPNMKDSHKGMKIKDSEFSAVLADLRKALEKNNVNKEAGDALVKLVAGTRKDIVEVPAKKDDAKKDDVKKSDEPKKEIKKDEPKKAPDKGAGLFFLGTRSEVGLPALTGTPRQLAVLRRDSRI